MLYSELLNLTEDQCTYEQYEEINEVYMSKESMTKQQAASLWKRRYAENKLKPLAKELREIKQIIRDFRKEKEYAELQEKRIRESYEEEIALFDPQNDFDKMCIENIKERRSNAIYKMWDDMGDDVSIHIIYEDGSECVAFGTDLISEEVIPKMQHIVYASYSDGYTTYDTLTGYLDDIWNMEEDAGFEAREEYFEDVEIIFGTEWGKKYTSNTITSNNVNTKNETPIKTQTEIAVQMDAEIVVQMDAEIAVQVDAEDKTTAKKSHEFFELANEPISRVTETNILDDPFVENKFNYEWFDIYATSDETLEYPRPPPLLKSNYGGVANC